MAKWGNALGGYRTQRRDSKGRFGNGVSGPKGSIKSSSKLKSKSKSSSKIKSKSKSSSFKKDFAKRAAITLAVAGAATYGASVAFNGRQETHSRMIGSLPKIGSVRSVSSSKVTVPSGSVAKPISTTNGSHSRVAVPPIDFGSARLDVGQLMGIAIVDPITGKRRRRS